MERRLLQETIVFFAEGGKTAAVEKVSVLFTSNDFPGASEPEIQSELIKHLSRQASQGYLKLFEKSAARFKEFWRRNDILLKTDNKKLILALRFAQYNLHVIIPIDRRSSIAAKGLSGEGYKGHVFWDTEVFMLPYYLYTDPQKARQLLEYRFDRIEQAMQNAKDRGYRGIMFPWESADTGKEETPRYANMNILTGKAARCWAGDKEHHVTADVAYAALQYWDSTGDWDFMIQKGRPSGYSAARCSGRAERSTIPKKGYTN